MSRALAKLLLAMSVLPILVLAGLLPSAAQAPEPQDPKGPAAALPSGLGRVEPALLKQALASPEQEYRFIVELRDQADLSVLQERAASPERVVGTLQASAARSQASLLSYLEAESAAGRVTHVRPFWVFNGVAIQGQAAVLLALAGRPEVAMIREDNWRQWVEPAFEPVPLASDPAALPWNVSRIGADRVWSTLVISGTGVTVAIMDTGVDWQHPALQAQYRGYKPDGLTVHQGNWLCTTDEGYLYPADGSGHGTHVTGTTLGAGGIGVAPGAQWIAVKAFNNLGYAYDSWVHAAFEWLMAPAGDPGLAPDVVNGSWGGASGEIESFRPDIQALRAAGIVPVFAAGNHGPDPSTVNNPASYPEAIAVGASDDLDQVATFSGRGPSSWDEIKPEVIAPGIEVYSSLPGGAYGLGQGTSMAAPHVAGLAALLLQADPDLTPDQVEMLITSTARPVGAPLPNNDAGWGRIDAYEAVAVALNAGTVAGRVSVSLDQQGIPNALVSVYDEANTRRATTRTDANGDYSIALPEGRYSIYVEAFGFEPQAVAGVSILSGMTTVLDFQLAPLPQGVLSGQVRDGETGLPLDVRIQAVGTPAFTTSDPLTGLYSLQLPVGTYAIEAERNGYRRHTVLSVGISRNQTTTLDFDLTPAPTLLLVDSGLWYYKSEAHFLSQALDDLDYVYAKWEIRDLATDVPTLEDLVPYEVTIWSSPLDSPGLIGAGDTISGYLSMGGNLFLTGQDVGFWDDGLSGFTWHEYYGRFLKTEVVSDDAGRGDLIGQPDGLLHDLTLEINGPDSAQNQSTPDSIALIEPRDAQILGVYDGDGSGASRASGCQSYRAVYLAAGLEGLGDRASRAEVMDRALDWLGAPPIGTAAELYPIHQAQVWSPGTDLYYAVELRNLGQDVDQFALELSPSGWPASVWDADFSTPLGLSEPLEPCYTQTLGVRVTIPDEIGWNVSSVVTLTARSMANPSQTAQTTFSSKTPAPVLLVDDHRWFDPTRIYEVALESSRIPYDLWLTQAATPGQSGYGPPPERMQLYRLLIWFTASDFHSPLAALDETGLTSYLDGGGSLLLSSMDYLDSDPVPSFAEKYLGVSSYVEGLTVTQVVDSVGNPAGVGTDAVALHYPFQNRTDALRFSEGAQPALWGQHDQPVALTVDQAPWKTAFFSFPLEALPEQDLADVFDRTVGWLSPLGDSSLSVDRSAAAEGEELGYSLLVRNTGPAPLAQVSMSNVLPAYTSLVPGSLQGPATYDPVGRRLTWVGSLAVNGQVEIGYRLLLDQSIPEGTNVHNLVHLVDESGLGLDRVATTRVDAPSLALSTMLAAARITVPGQTLVYTIRLSNNGTHSARAELNNPIPLNTEYVPGTAWASTGTLTDSAEAVSWSGTIRPGGAATLNIPVIPLASAGSRYVVNRALVTDGWGESTILQAYTWADVRVFFPFAGQH